MEKTVFSLHSLLWQVFNILMLVAVAAYLGWRVVQIIRRRMQRRRQK